MKQTIEVEVGPEDDAGWCRVESVDSEGAHYVTGVSADTLRGLGLTIPAEPAPERTEYRLDYLDHGNGRITGADEVLVAAHSLRVGDRIEWAPGDWREITKVELNDPEHAIHTFYVGDQRATYRGWDLLAVRR